MRVCFHNGVLAAALFAAPAVSRAETKAVVVARVDPRSGQQVRTIKVAAPRFAIKIIDAELKNLVEEAGRTYNVSPALIDSVIQVESNYNPRAVSPKGAQGLMQLMPGTAKRFGVRDSFDPRENVLAGVQYLKFLQETFKDDRLAVAAYNAGEGAVTRYNNVPPFPETRNYVAEVGKRYGKAKRIAEDKQKAPVAVTQTQPEKPSEPLYAHLRQYVDDEGKLHLTTQ